MARFWPTQPVLSVDTSVGRDGPVQATLSVPSTPHPLPVGLRWSSLELDAELEAFLAAHYLRDEDGRGFASTPSLPVLRAVSSSPWQPEEWRIGLREADGGTLVGTIIAVPMTLGVAGARIDLASVTFLCVREGYRRIGLAPLLIQEVTRRVVLRGRQQALYTTAPLLSAPYVSATAWQRPLRGRELVDLGFLEGTTAARAERRWGLPADLRCAELRPMTVCDVAGVRELLARYARGFTACPLLDAGEVAWWLLGNDVTRSFVKAEGERVTDLVSFYVSTATRMADPWGRRVRIATGVCQVATTVPTRALLHDAFLLAARAGAHVFRAIGVGPYASFLRDPGVVRERQLVHLYLFNWRSAVIPPEQLGYLLPM